MKTSLASKRIALISRSLSDLGGLEKYGRRISSHFKQLGADVTLVTEHEPTVKQKGFHYQALPIKGRRHKKIQAFSDQVSVFTHKSPFDVIFGLDRIEHQTHLRAGNGVHAAYLAYKEKVGAPFLKLKTWLNPSNKAILELEKKAFTSPYLNRIITNSHQVKEEIRSFYPECTVPITAIHNGVQWQEFETPFTSWQEEKLAFCKDKGLNPDTFFFLFIGHGFERKGLHFLLKALQKLKGEDVALLVVGKDKKARYFEALAKKLGLADKVHFFGSCKNTLPFFQTADAIVIPSIYDPFANVTVEALAMGLFVVSSPYNGGREVLNDQRGTVIESLHNPTSFAKALKLALKHKKTKASASEIRQSVAHLDFAHQLSALTHAILEDL